MELEGGQQNKSPELDQAPSPSKDVERALKPLPPLPKPGEKMKNPEEDHITEIIGMFGPFHAFFYFITALCYCLHCWQMMANKFYTHPTEYWCARPESHAYLSPEEWMNISAPMDDTGKYDRCAIFDVDFTDVYERPADDTNVIKCTSWEYHNDHFSETITARWDLVCGNMESFPRIVQIVFFVGNMLGVLVIGPYSDWFGRKIGFMTAITIWMVVTIIGYLVDNPFVWITTRFFAGATSLAFNTAGDVYRVEFTSGYWKSRTTHWFGFLFWQFGHLSLGLLVYVFPNMRHLELFIGLSALPWMLLWYFLPESPRWLLSKGRKAEAIEVLTMACKWNKKPAPKFEQLDLDTDVSDVQMGTIKDLMKLPATRRNALCMTLSWFAFSMGYFGLVYNTPAFDWNIYLVFVFPTFLMIPLSLLQPWMENRLGRKLVLTSTMLSAGICLLLTSVVPKGIIVIALAWVGTVLCETAFGCGYTFTKELFPTMLRTTALGMGSAGARVGSLSSPFIAMLDTYSPIIPLVTYGSIVLLSGIVSVWVWPETKDTPLPETLEAAEKMASTRNTWTTCCKRQQ